MKAKDIRIPLKKLLCACLVITFVPISPAMAGYGVDPESQYDEAQVLTGDILNIPTKNLSRVSVTDPLIADISDAKPDNVAVIGKEKGQTTLFVWDDSGKRTISVYVVDEDLSIVKTRIRNLLESAGINNVTLQENPLEGKVVLSGRLPGNRLEVMNKTLDPFREKVINLVQPEELEDLIQIDMQVTELSTTLSKAMGIDWFTGSGGDSLAPMASETMPAQDGSIGDIFKIGKFYRTSSSAISAKVNALIQEGKGRVLSKPRLVVQSGKEAKLLVGGEVPIRTTTATSTGTQENVSFKSYGISLLITPEIKNGRISIKLGVDISDLDPANKSGNDVAFVTRSAQTELFLDDRQTIVLAGLIKKSKNEAVNRVPLLGSIPVVGLLFRSKKTPEADQDTEVVISLTPTIIRAITESVSRVQSSYSSTPTGSTFSRPISSSLMSATDVNIQDIEPYARAIQEKISSAIAYPYEAQVNGWQGTVKLGMVIRRDGSLREIYVKESSGYDIFDQDAVNTAQILAPYAAFPSYLKEDQIAVTLPIVYSLDSFLKNIAKRN